MPILKRRFFRMVFLVFIAFSIGFTAVAERAEALPPGIYFLRVAGGRWQLLNLIGNVVWSGDCDPALSDCSNRFLYRIIIYRDGAGSAVPTLTPNDEVENLNADNWVKFINKTLQIDNSGESSDLTDVPEDPATLWCGTEDLTVGDPGEAPSEPLGRGFE